MNILEFKAWFEGFSEGVGDAPTPEQWGKIKAKVQTIDRGGYTGIRDVDLGNKRSWQDQTEPLTARYRDAGRLEAEGAN